MSYEVYRYIFIGATILCGIMFVVSVLLFVFLKVPKLISDLSGRTAKKAIKNIREQNEITGDKYHKISAFNEARGKLTDKISPSGQLQRKRQEVNFGINTTKISAQEFTYDEQNSETTILATNETSVLEPLSGATTVLTQVDNETTTVIERQTRCESNNFVVEFEITLIHTNEIIETEAV